MTNELWVCRHGETEWSRDGKHTSTTDLPLTAEGEEVAATLRERLAGTSFELVLTSPRLRARRTAELAGFGDVAEVDDDLVEWDYGDYEGITTDEIRQTVPGWTVFNKPTPGGETAEQVGERLHRVVDRARAASGKVLVFGHGHSLRVLAALWLQQDVVDGRHLRLDTSTISTLGYERETPVLLRWNT